MRLLLAQLLLFSLLLAGCKGNTIVQPTDVAPLDTSKTVQGGFSIKPQGNPGK